jgi:DNA-binding transcriptional MerR regulator
MVGLTIQQVAARTGLSAHTLRYYERAGLLSSVGRAPSGHRRYSESDIYAINFLTRLRAAGMPISGIQRYVSLAQQGDATAAERLAILEAHQQTVEQKIAELREHLVVISDKVAHYRDMHQTQLAQTAD